MIILAAADTLAAGASAASQLTCTVFGMELNGTTEVYKVLDQRQLAASPATIYTAPSNTTAFIRSITIINTNTTTAYTFQLFRGGTASTNAITPIFNLGAGSSANYEDGVGWSISEIGAGTTLLNDIHTGYSEYDAIANPSAPATGHLRFYARTISGRVLPKWMPPSGLDSPVQPALFGNNVNMYSPSSGTGVTGGWGTTWAKGGSAGTVSTPTPSNAAPAIINQMRRTRHANAATTTNQAMGIISTASGMPQFWRGNSAGCGGFFFFARFVVELWAADSCRLFVGMVASATEMVISDTTLANSVGLWHKTTDGAGVLYFMTRDASTEHLGSAIPGVTIAAGQGFDFYMYAKPNDDTIYYRLDDINAGTTLIDTSETNNLPVSTAFLGPQVEVSNGTANITVTTVAMGVNRIYIESDH